MCRLTYAVTRTEITTGKIMYDYEGWKIPELPEGTYRA